LPSYYTHASYLPDATTNEMSQDEGKLDGCIYPVMLENAFDRLRVQSAIVSTLGGSIRKNALVTVNFRFSAKPETVEKRARVQENLILDRFRKTAASRLSVTYRISVSVLAIMH
jgi:hypothetical protein